MTESLIAALSARSFGPTWPSFVTWQHAIDLVATGHHARIVAGNFFTDDRSHAPTEEGEVKDGEGDAETMNGTRTAYNCIGGAAFGDGGLNAITVILAVLEFKDVDRSKGRIHFNEGAGVNDQLDPFTGGDAKMVITLWADIEITLNLFGIYDFITVFAFGPNPFGDLLLPLFNRRQGRLFFTEPAHIPPGYVGTSRIVSMLRDIDQGSGSIHPPTKNSLKFFSADIKSGTDR